MHFSLEGTPIGDLHTRLFRFQIPTSPLTAISLHAVQCGYVVNGRGSDRSRSTHSKEFWSFSLPSLNPLLPPGVRDTLMYSLNHPWERPCVQTEQESNRGHPSRYSTVTRRSPAHKSQPRIVKMKSYQTQTKSKGLGATSVPLVSMHSAVTRSVGRSKGWQTAWSLFSYQNLIRVSFRALLWAHPLLTQPRTPARGHRPSRAADSHRRQPRGRWCKRRDEGEARNN